MKPDLKCRKQFALIFSGEGINTVTNRDYLKK